MAAALKFETSLYENKKVEVLDFHGVFCPFNGGWGSAYKERPILGFYNQFSRSLNGALLNKTAYD